MAESRSGSITGIVAVVALFALVAIVWFAFPRGGAAPTDGGVDIDVDLGEAVDVVASE